MDIRDEIAMAKLAKQQLIPPTTEQATPTKAFAPNLPSPEKLTKSAELNKELKAIEDLVVADSVEQLPNDKDDIEKISKKPLTPLKRLKLKKKTSPSKHQQTFEIKYRKEPNKDPKESKKLESEVEVTENDDGSMLLKDLKDDKKTPQKLVVKFKKVIQESEKDMKIGPTSEHLLSETPVHIPLKKITKSLESNKNGKNESKSKVQVKGASSVKKASKGKTVKGEVQKKRAPKIVMEERKSDDDFEDPKNEKNVKNKTQKEVQKSNSDDDFQVSNREKKSKRRNCEGRKEKEESYTKQEGFKKIIAEEESEKKFRHSRRTVTGTLIRDALGT